MGSFWRRSTRWLVALLILPVAAGCTWALADVVVSSARAVEFWLAILVGTAGWSIVFFGLPKPMWLYVVGHELTHVVWAWMSGGKVRSFKVGSKGGQVVVSKTNVLIALAPYFFPIYTVLWVLLYGATRWMFRGSDLPFLFHSGIGATYAFHITLTCHILRVRQPDIIGEGRIFSAVVIWLGNVLVLLVGLPSLASGTGIASAFSMAIERTGRVIAALGTFCCSLSP